MIMSCVSVIVSKLFFVKILIVCFVLCWFSSEKKYHMLFSPFSAYWILVRAAMAAIWLR